MRPNCSIADRPAKAPVWVLPTVACKLPVLTALAADRRVVTVRRKGEGHGGRIFVTPDDSAGGQGTNREMDSVLYRWQERQ